MQEFSFELALAAHVEERRDAIVSRQLGTHVHGRRVMDIVSVQPGPAFGERAAITAETIPPLAIESDIGPGESRRRQEAFDCHPDRAQAALEDALACGFIRREREGASTTFRQTTRYPEHWFDRIVGIENKPDLARPGALETQLRTDVSLGLLDAVVLATASHVTGAHRNRIPEPVGIWRFDPETGQRDVLREPASLPVDEPGVEILDRQPTRTEFRVADPAEIARARRRVAERAYGKGWRPETLPGCEHATATDDGRPYCAYYDRVVNPATDCGEGCPGYEPSEPPAVDLAAIRDERSPWVADPDGVSRSQSGLDRFL